MSKSDVVVIGAGLAGSEASYYLAQNGFKVSLIEMRPKKTTAAHHTEKFAELVCSNTFKSLDPTTGPGILKEELKILGSLILEAANASAVPGGQALAVDRVKFADYVTNKVRNHPNITLNEGEASKADSQIPTIIATGPLTTDTLAKWIGEQTDANGLYFYDAIAPIVDASTIDQDTSFLANRYDKGDEAAYINCPLTENEYEEFISKIQDCERVAPKPFEKENFFQGCQPIEAILSGGKNSLRFGPMKPVGLTDPRTGQRPFAVVQLRPENESKTAYNMVGFQTRLKYGDQKKVFQLIPALKNAEFLRMGSIHRNTYVCGPSVLNPDLSLKRRPKVYLAGQITGVEGYTESTACGLLAAIFMQQRLNKEPHNAPPANSALGALLRHIVGSSPKTYQPSNIHFGLFEPSLFSDVVGLKKNLARTAIAEQSLANLKNWNQFRSR